MSDHNTASEGTLSLYGDDDEVSHEKEIDVNAGELEEVAGGREVLPSNLPPAMTSEAPAPVGKREVMPSQLPPANTAEEVPRVSQSRLKAPPAAAKPSPGVKIEAIEALAAEGQWKKICVLLGAPENQGKLPARLALIYAIALNEARLPGEASDKRAPDIERFARQSFAALLNVDDKSPLVQMFVKRLMRRSWRAAPAPPTRTSVLLIVAAIMLGAFIGFLLGPGKDWFQHM